MRARTDNRLMPMESNRMKFRWLVASMTLAAVLVTSAAGCTTQRNARYCGDGACVDPAYPFCDVDGMFGDLRQQCVAVACAPGDFVACRGDHELRCNVTGTNYDVTRCELGCDSAGGCRFCEANQTACTNGTVSSCDAAGNVVSSETCPLGCFEDQPRCRDIDPSNGLGQYLDLVPEPPDLDLEGAHFDTGAGTITTKSGETIAVPSFGAANSGGPLIRVFVANKVRLKNVSAYSTAGPDHVSGPALAILARREIVIDGRLAVAGTAGGVKTLGCSGGIGSFFRDDRAVASGGGAHATPGARGGDIGTFGGGAGGQATGTDSLIPLRGGCPSGGAEDAETGAVTLYGSAGGGAVQLSSRVGIDVQGVIDVRGKPGDYEAAPGITVVLGGGAGGGILLEAPMVNLGSGARLIAKGGGGGTIGSSPSDDDSAAPSPGMSCPGTCPDGGNGAAPGVAAAAGESSPVTTGPGLISGGGGGGMGRVRINTTDATYLKSNTAIEAAIVTSGVLRTR